MILSGNIVQNTIQSTKKCSLFLLMFFVQIGCKLLFYRKLMSIKRRLVIKLV